MKKFLKSELGIFLAGAVFGFIAGNNWKPHSGQVDWWLTVTFLIILLGAILYYLQNQKGKK